MAETRIAMDGDAVHKVLQAHSVKLHDDMLYDVCDCYGAVLLGLVWVPLFIHQG